MPRPPLVMLALLVSASGVRADTVELEGGGKLEGEVHRVGDKVIVETGSGTIAIAHDNVEKLVRAPSTVRIHDERRAALAKDDVDGRVKLARFCSDHRLPRRALELWREVLALDPEHAEARAGLGHVRRGDRWVEVAARPADRRTAESSDARERADVERLRTHDREVERLRRERTQLEHDRARLDLERQREAGRRQEAQHQAELDATRKHTVITHYASSADERTRNGRARQRACNNDRCRKKRRIPARRPSYYDGPAHRDFPIAGVKHPRQP